FHTSRARTGFQSRGSRGRTGRIRSHRNGHRWPRDSDDRRQSQGGHQVAPITSHSKLQSAYAQRRSRTRTDAGGEADESDAARIGVEQQGKETLAALADRRGAATHHVVVVEPE